MVDVQKSPAKLSNENDQLNSRQKVPDSFSNSKKNNKQNYQKGVGFQRNNRQTKTDFDKSKRNSQYSKNDRSGQKKDSNEKFSQNKKDRRPDNKVYRRSNENVNQNRTRGNDAQRNNNKTATTSQQTENHIIKIEGEGRMATGVWTIKKDWRKHFAQDSTESTVKEEKQQQTSNDVQKTNDNQKVNETQKPQVNEKKEEVPQNSKEQKQDNVGETKADVTKDVEQENSRTSNEDEKPKRTKVHYPPMVSEYDNVIQVTFTNVIHSENPKEDVENKPEYPPHFSPPPMTAENASQFVIPPNNMNFRYPIYPPMYNQPLYPGEFPNGDMGWDPNYNPRNMRNKRNLKKNHQPKRNKHFPQNSGNETDENRSENNTDNQDVNSDNRGDGVNENYMYRPPEHFGSFYGSNPPFMHGGMMISPFYNQYTHQMFGYYPTYDNNFDNNANN